MSAKVKRIPTSLTIKELMSTYAVGHSTAGNWHKLGIPEDRFRGGVATTAASVASSAPTALAVGEEEDDGMLEVEVKVDDTPRPAEPKPSVKDWFFNKFKADSSEQPKKQTTRKKKPNLITNTLPLLVSGFVTTYARTLIHDPYKPCAPSQEEVTGMVGPLFDILGREVEITGKASQNTIDLITAVMCSFTYGLRAFMTYVDIKQELKEPGYVEKQREAYREKLNREAAEYEPVATGTVAGAGGHNGSGAQYAAALHAISNDAQRGNNDSADGDQERKTREAEIISNMFKRDVAGRIRLGLLPPRVPGSDNTAS